MATKPLVGALTELLEPLAEANGLELVAVEQTGGRKRPVIRVLLDKDGGIDIDAIMDANRWVSDAIDDADPISGPYTLEVSSPGVDRPLVKRADFDRFAGETVTVKARTHDARATWTGTLVGTEGDDVVLTVDGDEVRVAYDDIQKARIKGVIDFGTARRSEQR